MPNQDEEPDIFQRYREKAALDVIWVVASCGITATDSGGRGFVHLIQEDEYVADTGELWKTIKEVFFEDIWDNYVRVFPDFVDPNESDDLWEDKA